MVRKQPMLVFKSRNNTNLLVNMVNWLATKESYTSLTEVSGLTLDTATTLFTWEQPANTTEPQTEPWATPATGYKWYDPSTFKTGSYGVSSSTNTTDPFAFVHQAQLPNHYVFQVKIILNGLAANSTTGYNLGIYNGSGTQVAKVQNSDGAWPSSYGYSTSFSMTANASGFIRRRL